MNSLLTIPYIAVQNVVRNRQKTLTSVLGKFDLRPMITFTAPDPGAPPPQLLIAGETVLQGAPRNRWNFEAAIRKSLSGW